MLKQPAGAMKKPLNAGQKPETIRQAETFTTVRNYYAGIGLCNRCAAQAAWGHEDGGTGFKGIHDPCAKCQPLVDTFPAPAYGKWRKCMNPANAAIRVGPPVVNVETPETDSIPATAYHPKCGKRFGNSDNIGHCAVCCETFFGPTAFDDHLSRDGEGKYLHLDPSTTEDHKWWLDRFGYWHHSERLSEEQTAALIAVRARI
jgi:hypothetical protein